MQIPFKIIFVALAFVLSLAHVSDCRAQEKAQAKESDDKKRTSIDFEDELIQGEMKKPELFYLLQKKQFNFKRLIKLRNDFLPEMKRSAEEIRRDGSDN